MAEQIIEFHKKSIIPHKKLKQSTEAARYARLKKAGQILDEHLTGAFDGAAARRLFIKRLKEMKNDDSSSIEKIEKRERELFGGECPRCQMEWEKIVVDNQKMKTSFHYFRPKCKCEITAAEEKAFNRMILYRLKNAEVPDKFLQVSFDTWDNTIDPNLTLKKNEVQKHFYEKKFKAGYGLVLLGDVGTGKTRCAVSLLRLAAAYIDSIFFFSMSEFISKMFEKGEGEVVINRLKNVRLVILDDFDKISSASDWARTSIFRVVDKRCNDGDPMIITSNLHTPQDFDKKFGEAITSRIFGSCFHVYFKGRDYRKVRFERKKAMMIEKRLTTDKEDFEQDEFFI